MIVFWRLFLAWMLTDFVFSSYLFSWFRQAKRTVKIVLRVTILALLALAFCHHYLTEAWPFVPGVFLPGWVCVLSFALFHEFVAYFYDLGGQLKYGYTLTFVLQLLANGLFITLISPFRALYETGNFFAEPWVVFLAGLVVATRVLGGFIFALEQDKYGRDYPTFDEQWLLALVRAIFFLVMMLPGLRWAVAFVVWLGACLYARSIRLLDMPGWAFYLGVFGAGFIGLLVRLRFYLVG